MLPALLKRLVGNAPKKTGNRPVFRASPFLQLIARLRFQHQGKLRHRGSPKLRCTLNAPEKFRNALDINFSAQSPAGT
jgi:hypothetical protein